jgi:hypothetical protein
MVDQILGSTLVLGYSQAAVVRVGLVAVRLATIHLEGPSLLHPIMVERATTLLIMVVPLAVAVVVRLAIVETAVMQITTKWAGLTAMVEAVALEGILTTALAVAVA